MTRFWLTVTEHYKNDLLLNEWKWFYFGLYQIFASYSFQWRIVYSYSAEQWSKTEEK